MTVFFDGAAVLIRHPGSESGLWLTRSDQTTNQLKLIIAERLGSESPRETVDRELAWQLRLNRGKDYLISSVARLHFEGQLTLPGEDEARAFCIEFFIVEPYGQHCRDHLLNDPQNRWLSRAELLSGCSTRGEIVCPISTGLLKAADVISVCE